ncbi:TerD family protein [Streptomyces narbonensis]|uniref:TerD family protein n=1 Tax=Streptomyces narbonensis TaxID=67333 RepID=A0ABV3CBF8_9ACTN
MIKGENSFVPSVALRIAVRGAGVDAMALLLMDGGTVGDDGDVVFHGAPVHPSGAIRLMGAVDGTAWLDVALTTVEERISRVLVVGSTENGTTMRDVAGLSVEAYAPDGTSVVRYDVTDGGPETAMVLAELYRRAGGWKFRAVGQGYANGLAGLATDHGVDVARPAAAQGPQAMPVPVPAPVSVPMPAPLAPTAPPVPTFALPPQPPVPPVAPAAPVALFTPVAPFTPAAPAAPVAPVAAVAPVAPVVAPVVAPDQVSYGPAWSYGPVFAPYTQSGRDNDVITVSGLPPGPVVVQLAVRGDGYTGLTVLDWKNKEKDYLVNSTEDDFRGRVLATVPRKGNLRLRLEAEGPWQVEVSPLAAARVLTEQEQEFRGPDVLLHTAGVADLAIQYGGDDNLIVNIYEVARHDDHTALPQDDNIVNEIGERRETVPLPAGPLVVQFEAADGPWRARLKRV